VRQPVDSPAAIIVVIGDDVEKVHSAETPCRITQLMTAITAAATGLGKQYTFPPSLILTSLLNIPPCHLTGDSRQLDDSQPTGDLMITDGRQSSVDKQTDNSHLSGKSNN
jgi:hypothetical protein